MNIYMKNAAHSWKFALATLLAGSLAACGGGGGSSSVEQKNAVSGSLVKGPVVNATIEVRTINPVFGTVSEELLGSAVTGPDGTFSLDIGAIDGALLINSLGGSFVDESDQNNDGGQRRQVLLDSQTGFSVYRPAGVGQVAITILTDAMTQRAFALAQNQQISVDNAFDAVRTLSTQVLGFDPLTTRALSPLNPGPATTQERNYALLLGGLAVAANQLAIQVGLPQVDAEVIAALVTDLADGNLDGVTSLPGEQPQALIVNGSAIPDIDLSAAIALFRNNNDAQYQGVTPPTVNEAALAVAPTVTNTPPSLQVDSQNLLALEGVPLQLTGLSLIASDAETASIDLRYVVLQGPVAGVVTDGQRALNEGHEPVASLDYFNQTYPAGGVDSIIVAVLDEDNGFALATLPLTIDRRPVLQDDNAVTAEDTNVLIDVLDNDSDLDGSALTITAVSNAFGGVATISANQVDFAPTLNFFGPAGFRYTASDAGGHSVSADVTIAVTAVNDAPVVQDGIGDTLVHEEQPFDFTFPSTSFFDVEGDPLLFTASDEARQPLPEWLVFEPTTRRFTGLADDPQLAGITVRVTADDQQGGAVSDSFVISVSPVDDAPTISDIADLSTEESTATEPLGFTVADVDTPLVNLSVQAVSDNLSLLPNQNISLSGTGANRSVILAPTNGQTGSALVTITVSDGNSNVADSFILTVTPPPDEDADGVPDQIDQCPNSPINETADELGCTPGQLQLNLNGAFNVIAFGLGQSGPGAPEHTPDEFSSIRFRLEPYTYTITDLNINGSEGDDQDVSLNRFLGGGDIFLGSFNDCQQDPQGCVFSETLIRKDDVLFVPGFVDANASDFGQGDRVEFDTTQRNAFVPVVTANSAQALIGSEFVAHQSLPALDIDLDDQADPDLNDPEYGSALEPLPGALGRSGEVFLSLALRAPAQLHSASEFAGSYGYIGYVQTASKESESPTFSASVDAYRGDLVVDASGTITGAISSSTTISSLELGDVSVTSDSAQALQPGSSLAAENGGDPGAAVLTLVFPGNDTIVLNGAMSEDASMGGFGFFESTPAQSEAPIDVELEFGVAVRRASTAPNLANSARRVTMLGREFGCGFGSSVAAAQNAQILITSEITQGCDTALGPNTQCYDASFNAIDGHSFSEARQLPTQGGPVFGELTLDGSASEGDFVPGAARVATGVVKVNDNGLFRLELFGEQQGVVEDTYNGYVGDNGAVIFEGGSEEIGGQGCDFANRFLGFAVEVLGPLANAGLDNQAPEVVSVTPSEPFPILSQASVTLSATAIDNENDTLSYNWVARAGTLTNADTSMVGWTAPDTSSGATVLELHVRDELNTTVELVEVSWGLAEANADQKLSGELVIEHGSFVPKDVREMFLLFTPVEEDVVCLSGSVNRSYTNGSAGGTQENPLAGDTVTVTAADCVVSSSATEESSLLSGTWQMDITQSSGNDYGWTTTLSDFVREFRECTPEPICQAEDSDTDNAVFQVLAQGVAVENAVAPLDTTEQTDITVTFTSYTSVERERDPGQENMLVEISTTTVDPATSFVLTDWSDEVGPLAFRLGGTAGLTAREPLAQSDFIDIDIAIGPDGVRQDFDQFNNLMNPEGQLSLTAVIFDIAPIAADSQLDVNYIPTPTGDIDVVMDIDVSQQAGADFSFSTTLQEVADADECDLSTAQCGQP